ncbi:MAG: hypothetical protein U1B79_01440 [Candidatus Pacearchaeota archaeon]|nr:hypothetical protein [Nanoarchaeota archaeon]MDZ4226755.1 hypothetical protein [Candidatus Pacearchaeota archaeon]
MAKKASSKRGKSGKARSIRKRANSGTKSTEVVYHSTKEIKVERALIENFIGLQRVMVNLSAKFESLSSQISKLLDLFEISAKALAKKEFSSSGGENLEAKRIMEKLDNLSQQAGLIGRGLSLIHEVRTEGERPVIPFNAQRNKVQFPSPTFSSPVEPLQGNQMESTQEKMTKEMEGFEKSGSTIRGQKPGENVRTNF